MSGQMFTAYWQSKLSPKRKQRLTQEQIESLQARISPPPEAKFTDEPSIPRNADLVKRNQKR